MNYTNLTCNFYPFYQLKNNTYKMVLLYYLQYATMLLLTFIILHILEVLLSTFEEDFIRLFLNSHINLAQVFILLSYRIRLKEVLYI